MNKAVFEIMLSLILLTGLAVSAQAQDQKQREKKEQTRQQQQQSPPDAGSSGEAAAPAPVACPGLILTKPDRTIRDGEQAALGVTFGSEFKGQLVYIWTISAGSFLSGQGTKNIMVDTTGASADKGFTATVQISGLPLIACACTCRCTPVRTSTQATPRSGAK